MVPDGTSHRKINNYSKVKIYWNLNVNCQLNNLPFFQEFCWSREVIGLQLFHFNLETRDFKFYIVLNNFTHYFFHLYIESFFFQYQSLGTWLHLPGKKTFGNMEQEFIEKRRDQLENYIQVSLHWVFSKTLNSQNGTILCSLMMYIAPKSFAE